MCGKIPPSELNHERIRIKKAGQKSHQIRPRLQTPSVTLVHKGNIMKFTEGAFKDWGYQVAAQEFGDFTVTENDVSEKFGGKAPSGKIVIKDRIADSMFQQVLLRPTSTASSPPPI